MTRGVHRAFGVLATAVVIASVAWGFMIAGSPDTRRQERMDARRLEALQAIQAEIQDLTIDADLPLELRAPLPKTLDELASRAVYRKIEPDDPQTGTRYTYRVLTATTYQLCATFALPRDARRKVFWNPPAGEHRYTIDVMDPPR